MNFFQKKTINYTNKNIINITTYYNLRDYKILICFSIKGLRLKLPNKLMTYKI